MKRQYNTRRITPPSWWVRCAVMALACIQVAAPTWHICSEGATGSAPIQKAAQTHCACALPQTTSNNNGVDQLSSQPMAMDFCLAKLLQHVLGNNQFLLVLDFNAVTISTLPEAPAATPLLRALPVEQARGPPLHLL